MGSNPISIIILKLIMNKKLNIFINLIELRFRLFYCFFSFLLLFFISFIYKIELLFFFCESFLLLQSQFIYTGLLDPLIIYIKACILTSIIFVIPVILYVLGFFFFKSINNNQIIFFFSSSIIIYNIIILLCYVLYKVLSFYLLEFLLLFQESKIESLFQLYLQATIVQYYGILLKSFYLYIILALFPLGLLFLSMLKIIPEDYFLGFYYRKYFYLIISLILILFMPPDFFIQIMIIPVVFGILEFYFYLITCYFLLFKHFFY